ncbi:VOC family protein [Brevibacillus sp. SYP-B805]|uniref:VOC family protein n=1 Tax=Brevibacillus sp. SYP-B805 TaxID=1578199 RepID=UPI0013ED97B2|nr:VOC family protein [Brevibacillus sp. SYP-B805]
MEFAFDHLVHFVNDPKRAAQLMRESGLHAVEGGRHTQWGSYNSLCYFDLSYIEFLGLDNPGLAKQVADNDLIRQATRELPAREGLARIAIRTGNIDEAAERIRVLGFRVTGPFPGSRTRDDGTVINWSMFFIRDEGSELPLPFVIQWGQSDQERRKDLEQRGVIRAHRLGQISLNQVAFAVRDLERTVQTWGRLFELEQGEAFFDPTMNAECRILKLRGGDLLFCRPVGEGVVSQVLHAAGERPFLVQLTGAANSQTLNLFGGMYQCT